MGRGDLLEIRVTFNEKNNKREKEREKIHAPLRLCFGSNNKHEKQKAAAAATIITISSKRERESNNKLIIRLHYTKHTHTHIYTN